MTKREALLKKLSTYQFAALDLQLFLDTHPNDENTIEKMNMFKMKVSTDRCRRTSPRATTGNGLTVPGRGKARMTADVCI